MVYSCMDVLLHGCAPLRMTRLDGSLTPTAELWVLLSAAPLRAWPAAAEHTYDTRMHATTEVHVAGGSHCNREHKQASEYLTGCMTMRCVVWSVLNKGNAVFSLSIMVSFGVQCIEQGAVFLFSVVSPSLQVSHIPLQLLYAQLISSCKLQMHCALTTRLLPPPAHFQLHFKMWNKIGKSLLIIRLVLLQHAQAGSIDGF